MYKFTAFRESAVSGLFISAHLWASTPSLAFHYFVQSRNILLQMKAASSIPRCHSPVQPRLGTRAASGSWDTAAATAAAAKRLRPLRDHGCCFRFRFKTAAIEEAAAEETSPLPPHGENFL